MQTVAVAFPLQPGQYDRIRAHQADVVGGNHHEHWHDVGMAAVKMWHQTDPIEAVVIYLEADDLAYVLDPDEHGHKPGHYEWVTFLQEVSGGGQPASLPDLLVDWHRDDGHKVGVE